MINPILILIAELEKLDPKPTILLGSWEEISSQLSTIGISGVLPSGRYPAIVIPIGFEYAFGTSIINEAEISDIPMYLITDTRANVNLTTRYSSTYGTILYPLAEKLEQRLIKSNKFDIWVKDMNNEISKKVTEHPFDIKGTKDQNRVKEVVDCLEIRYDKIKIKNTNV